MTEIQNNLFTSMEQYKHFKLREFDSPDLEGSGERMDAKFLSMLDKAREVAGIPFKITSGYRTHEHNSYLLANGYKASPNSSHKKGLACDISAVTSRQKFVIVSALLSVGFHRIGVGSNFIHVDDDQSKPSQQMWTY